MRRASLGDRLLKLVASLARKVADRLSARIEADDVQSGLDQSVDGPPAHWVARVKAKAPWLLEPHRDLRAKPTRRASWRVSRQADETYAIADLPIRHVEAPLVGHRVPSRSEREGSGGEQIVGGGERHPEPSPPDEGNHPPDRSAARWTFPTVAKRRGSGILSSVSEWSRSRDAVGLPPLPVATADAGDPAIMIERSEADVKDSILESAAPSVKLPSPDLEAVVARPLSRPGAVPRPPRSGLSEVSIYAPEKRGVVDEPEGWIEAAGNDASDRRSQESPYSQSTFEFELNLERRAEPRRTDPPESGRSEVPNIEEGRWPELPTAIEPYPDLEETSRLLAHLRKLDKEQARL